jgi:UDP-N-acetylmuramoyl-tripeptide--D-alanyl-D-alanine ligase
MPEPRFTQDILNRGLTPLRVFGPGMRTDGISTDTRNMKLNDLFIALIGEHFDAHDYLDNAAAAGASGLVVSRESGLADFAARHPELTIFLVEDTLAALGRLAAFWRTQVNPLLIGITGSNGKTTTKELTAAICATHASTLKTEGNFNNLIGMPLTLLNLRNERLAIIEMGMNQRGEIAQLARIARPSIGVITVIGAAHLELLGSIENVMAAKGELFDALPGDGLAIVNLDNPYTAQLAKTHAAPRNIRMRTVSLTNKSADLYTTRIDPRENGYRVEISAEGRLVDIHLPLPGEHNIMNTLCAMAAAQAAGIDYADMAEGIATCTVPGRRLKIRTYGPYTVIDDCYNANPASMQAALRMLKSYATKGRRVALLGDMLELGENSAAYHRELGELAARSGVERLGIFGGFAEQTAAGAHAEGLSDDRVFATTDMAKLGDWLRTTIKSGDLILIKGSRGARMERTLDVLSSMAGEGA